VISNWPPWLRLAAFALMLAVTFGVALAIGAAVG
jgi:hypothetical protein